MSYFQVANGDVVGSVHMNTAINQGIPPFANVAARDAAITAPVEGMKCYVSDAKTYYAYDGAAWRWMETIGGRYIKVGINGDKTGLSNGGNVVPFSQVLEQNGDGLSLSGPDVQVAEAGLYEVSTTTGVSQTGGSREIVVEISDGTNYHRCSTVGNTQTSTDTLSSYGAITLRAAANTKFGVTVSIYEAGGGFQDYFGRRTNLIVRQVGG